MPSLSRASSASPTSPPTSSSAQSTRPPDTTMPGANALPGPLGASQAPMAPPTTWTALPVPPHPHGTRSSAPLLASKSTGFHPSPPATPSVPPKAARSCAGTSRPTPALQSGTQANAGSSGNVASSLTSAPCTLPWLKSSMHRECLSSHRSLHWTRLQAGRQPCHGVRPHASHLFRPPVRRKVLRGPKILLCHRIQDNGRRHEYLSARSFRLSLVCLCLVFYHQHHRFVRTHGLDKT